MSAAHDERQRLSSGGLLARNVGFAAVGQGLSIVAALVALPVLVHALGTARLGVLLLAWVAIGYAGVFDLGLGRALTKMSAEYIGAGRSQELPALFWTAGVATTAVGLVLMVVIAAISPWLAGSVLNIPAELRDDATFAFLLLAVSVPATLTSSSWRGYLEALQRFDILMVVNVGMSIVSYGGAAVLVLFVPSLTAVVALLVASRLVALVAVLVIAMRVTPGIRRGVAFRRSLVPSLLRYGGWVSLTAVGVSTIGTLDRFIVGALVTASAVAFYATPVDAVSKMLIASTALVGVLFPAFALNFRSEPARAARLFGRGTDYAFLALFPMALVLVAFAPEILSTWLGEEFAENSAFAMQWLAVGTLMTGVAQVSFAFVQSDRPDLNAKLVAIELPVYIASFVVAVEHWGVDGAAVVYSIRGMVDAAGLAVFAALIQPAVRAKLRRQWLLAFAGLLVLAVAGQLDTLAMKIGFISLTLCVCAVTAWKLMLEEPDRAFMRARIGRLRLRRASL